MSSDTFEVNCKRKRHDNDSQLPIVRNWLACNKTDTWQGSQHGSKRSRCEHLSKSGGLPKTKFLCTASQAHALVESPRLCDESELRSVNHPLINFVIDDGWDELCETHSILNRNSPAYTELALPEIETPNTVYSTDSAPSVQKLPMSPGSIGPDHSITSRSKIRESQQAFTIYASAGISQRKYKGPSSLQAFAQWFHVNSHIMDKDLSEQFRHGLRHSEESDMPPYLSMPALCPEWEDYVDAYFQEIAPLFPVMRRENTIRTATYLSRFGLLEQNPTSDRPAMACVYACVALGARVKGQTGVAQAYIEAACSLTGYLMSLPYLESAQALLLIAIEYRGREKNGAAFLAVRQAISILNSMGLHRTPSYGNDHLSVAHQQMDRRIWWTAYALEKTIALEDGRPSSTHDRSLDQDFPTDGPAMYHLGAWKAFVSLAKIQSQISEGFFDQNMWRNTLNFDTMLEMQSQLNEALAKWSNTLPEPLKPSTSPANCTADDLTLRTLLIFHYHHALIALHRSALTEDINFDDAISQSIGKETCYTRGSDNSEFICVNSAREILESYLHFVKGGRSSPLVTLNQPLLAVYVLTAYTLKYPSASSTHQDLKLVISATHAIEKGYQQIGVPAGFSRVLSTLRDAAMRGTGLYTGAINSPYSQPTEILRCAGSCPVEGSVHTSESAATTTESILMPEELLLVGLSNNRSSGSERATNLGAMNDILAGTWLDVQNEHITEYAP